MTRAKKRAERRKAEKKILWEQACVRCRAQKVGDEPTPRKVLVAGEFVEKNYHDKCWHREKNKNDIYKTRTRVGWPGLDIKILFCGKCVVEISPETEWTEVDDNIYHVDCLEISSL